MLSEKKTGNAARFATTDGCIRPMVKTMYKADLEEETEEVDSRKCRLLGRSNAIETFKRITWDSNYWLQWREWRR